MRPFKQIARATLRFTHLDRLFRTAEDPTQVTEHKTLSTFVLRNRRRKDHRSNLDADLALIPDDLSRLTSWFINAREIRSEELQWIAKVDMVEHELERLARVASKLRRHLMNSDCGEVDVSDHEHDALRRELAASQAKLERLEELRAQWIEELESIRDHQRQIQLLVLTVLQNSFLRQGRLQYNESPSITMPDFDAILPADHSREHNTIEREDNRLSRVSSTTTTVATRRSKSSTASAQTVLQAEAEVDEKAELQDTFSTLKGYLDMAEQDLEYRDIRQDRERREYHKARAVGEDVPDLLTFDLEQFLETQRLTQAVAEAEADLAEAKSKALAAGANINSDIDSDFVFDPDDGDRASAADDDDAGLVEPSVIPAWVDKLPEVQPDVAEETARQVDVDDWDARSVEIHDSWSMRAEGPEKRRIERWRHLLSKSLERAVQSMSTDQIK